MTNNVGWEFRLGKGWVSVPSSPENVPSIEISSFVAKSGMENPLEIF
jgi:hypothetical protein